MAEKKQQHRQRWREIELAAVGAKGQHQQRRQHGTDSDGGGANLDWHNQKPQDGSGGDGKTATTVTSAVAAQTFL